MQKQLTGIQLKDYTPASSFALICGGRVITIAFKDIVRIEKLGSSSIIHTRESIFQTHRSLQELLNELPVPAFFRISVNDVIAMAQVKRFTRHKAYIGGVSLLITDYYRRQLLTELRWMMLRENTSNSVTHEL